MQRRIVDVDGQIRTIVDLRGDKVVLRDADVYLRDRGPYEQWVKPAFDVLGAVILIVLLSPVMLGCAIAVYVSLGSPVILRQARVGRGGRIFDIYKFRTMEPDRREAMKPFDGEDRRISHKRSDDPRITEVGRFLRKWSLDELPQFFNVIRGDMSLVGPRPELVQIVAEYQPWQHARHAVKPGITGPWQVSERGGKMLHEATDIDIEYVESISFWQDCAMLLRTVPAAFGVRTGT